MTPEGWPLTLGGHGLVLRLGELEASALRLGECYLCVRNAGASAALNTKTKTVQQRQQQQQQEQQDQQKHTSVTVTNVTSSSSVDGAATCEDSPAAADTAERSTVEVRCSFGFCIGRIVRAG